MDVEENTVDTPAIQVIGITKRYDRGVRKITSAIEVKSFIDTFLGRRARDLVALDNVNLSIPPGEVFGLLGHNGAGKTTLIKILSTLVLPDAGQALVYGTDVVEHPRAILKKLQTVLSEHFGFERRLTGRQNLEFYATLYGLPRDMAKKRIDELLEFCQLTEVADDMFQKYSTGMTRKLLVSRALLTDASVLLLDEPTNGLDPASASDFKLFLKNVLVKERGKTLIWATHNLFEAQQVCDTIGVLKEGKLVAKGTPAEIRNTIAEKVSLTITLFGNGAINHSDGLERISRINGITKLDARKGMEPGNILLDIEATRDIDYNRIFEMVSAMGFKITALEASQPSLEEAFVRLTRGVAE